MSDVIIEVNETEEQPPVEIIVDPNGAQTAVDAAAAAQLALEQFLAAGGGGGNRKSITKFVTLNPDPEIPEHLQIMAAVNSLGTWNFDHTISAVVFVVMLGDIWSSDPITTKRYWLINRGVGTYGMGAIPIYSKDLMFLNQSGGPTVGDIDDDPSKQRVPEIGFWDITGTTVRVFLNSRNPAIELQDFNDGPVLIKALNDGVEESYWFVGPGGIYGIGNLQATDEDFQPLATVPQSEYVTEETVAEMIAAAGSDQDFYRSWFSHTVSHLNGVIYPINSYAISTYGTATHIEPTGNSRYNSLPFLNYAGGTGAGSNAGVKQDLNADLYIRDGFDAVFVFANNDNNQNRQTMVGSYSLATQPPNLSISDLLADFFGVGNDVGDANLSFYCKRLYNAPDAASFVKIDLGGGFPQNTTTDAYMLRMEAPNTNVETERFIKMTIVNLVTMVSATHTFPYTETPKLNRPFLSIMMRNNRNTGAVPNMRMHKISVLRKLF